MDTLRGINDHGRTPVVPVNRVLIIGVEPDVASLPVLCGEEGSVGYFFYRGESYRKRFRCLPRLAINHHRPVARWRVLAGEPSRERYAVDLACHSLEPTIVAWN